jgi:hypothetical protein
MSELIGKSDIGRFRAAEFSACFVPTAKSPVHLICVCSESERQRHKREEDQVGEETATKLPSFPVSSILLTYKCITELQESGIEYLECV